DGVESTDREVAGLGLLPVVTRFARDKVTHPVRLRLGDGVPLIDGAGGQEAIGYEIHCGRVEPSPRAVAGARPLGTIVRRGDAVVDEPEGCIVGRVAGTPVHGLFENGNVRAALGVDGAATADPYDALADGFAAALDMAHLDRLVGL